MPDGAELSIDTAKLQRDGDELVRRYLTVGTHSVHGATRELERALEAATRSGVPGKLWKAWTSSVFPEKGIARNPAGTVYASGRARTRGALTYWTEQGSSRSRRGGFFAIPLPAAGSPARSRTDEFMLTPAQWEARTGIKLRAVFRPGKAGLLVADGARLSGKRQIARASRTRQLGPAARGTSTVPVFVLIPLIRFRGTVAVSPLVKAAEIGLVNRFLADAPKS